MRFFVSSAAGLALLLSVLTPAIAQTPMTPAPWITPVPVIKNGTVPGSGGGLTPRRPAKRKAAAPVRRPALKARRPVRRAVAAAPAPRPVWSAEERRAAQVAWRYFLRNLHPDTGLVYQADDRPSATVRDQGHALMALFSARHLGLLSAKDYDVRLTRMLATLARMPLYRGELPNRYYDARTGRMTDADGQPTETGVGFSGLDLGRLASALAVVRASDPAHRPQIDQVLLSWRWQRLTHRGTLMSGWWDTDRERWLSEPGLANQDYAVRAFAALGLKGLKAPPVGFRMVEGVRVPYDARDFGASGLVVPVRSEPYVLAAVELGLPAPQAIGAQRVYEAQRRRYLATGAITAVDSVRLDRAPHDLTYGVLVDGTPWKAIAPDGVDASALRTVSTRAALGWHVLYRSPYTQIAWGAVKEAYDPGRGFYAGRYEGAAGYDQALDAATNAMVLESLLFARSRKPLLRPLVGTGLWEQYRKSVADLRGLPGGRKLPPTPLRRPAPLTLDEHVAARKAWTYFDRQVQPETGLVPERAGAFTTGMGACGDGLVAIAAAERLGLLSEEDGRQQAKRLLRVLIALPLAAEVAPGSRYTLEGRPAGEDGQPVARALGWDALELGRLLHGMAAIALRHPELYAEMQDWVGRWRLAEVIRDGRLYGATASGAPERQGHVGAEQYAAQGFALWGHTAGLALDGGLDRNSTRLGAQEVPTDRRPGALVTSEPWLLHMLEHPSWGRLGREAPYVYHAQWERARLSHRPVATGAGPIDRAPWRKVDTLLAGTREWETFGPAGEPLPRLAGFSTGAAFGWAAVYRTSYAGVLKKAVRGLESPSGGWFGGKYHVGGVNRVADARTNALVLEALSFQSTGPLLDGWSRLRSQAAAGNLPVFKLTPYPFQP